MARSKKKGIMLSKRIVDSVKLVIGNNIGKKNQNELIFKNKVILKNKPIVIFINFDDIYDSNSFFVQNIKVEYEMVDNYNNI